MNFIRLYIAKPILSFISEKETGICKHWNIIFANLKDKDTIALKHAQRCGTYMHWFYNIRHTNVL